MELVILIKTVSVGPIFVLMILWIRRDILRLIKTIPAKFAFGSISSNSWGLMTARNLWKIMGFSVEMGVVMSINTITNNLSNDQSRGQKFVFIIGNGSCWKYYRQMLGSQRALSDDSILTPLQNVLSWLNLVSQFTPILQLPMFDCVNIYIGQEGCHITCKYSLP